MTKNVMCCKRDTSRFALHWFSLQSKDAETRNSFIDFNVQRVNLFVDFFTIQFSILTCLALFRNFGIGMEAHETNVLRISCMTAVLVVMSVLKRLRPSANVLGVVLIFVMLFGFDLFHEEGHDHEKNMVELVLGLIKRAFYFMLLGLMLCYDHRVMIFCLAPLFVAQ